MPQKGYEFVSLQNSGNYPPTIGTAQDQALRTEKFQQNQALCRIYTAVDGEIKNKIIILMEPVFLYPLLYQLTRFGQVSALVMIQHLFASYRVIYEIDIEENVVNMMGPYDPTETLSRLIEKLEKGR